MADVDKFQWLVMGFLTAIFVINNVASGSNFEIKIRELIKDIIDLKSTEEIEKYVKQYGEKYRNVIDDSLTWLRKKESSWDLQKPMDHDKYIEDMIGRIK